MTGIQITPEVQELMNRIWWNGFGIGAMVTLGAVFLILWLNGYFSKDRRMLP